MSTYPWIIIMTHGYFGAELKKSAELVLGPLNEVHCLSLTEGTDPMDFAEELNILLEKAPDNTIILTDLYGGTPSNVSAIYATRKNYTVVSGVNLPILIEAEMSRTPEGLEDSEGFETLAERLISAGTGGISDIRKIMEEMRKK
jgi:mannose/fructose-specific phosphotransferase system component IIA